MTVDLTGSHVAMITPLTAERSVHHDDVVSFVGQLVAEGARGVLVAGSTGEGTLLEPDERAELVATTRRAIDRHASGAPEAPVALLAGGCGMTVGGVHADVARLADAGADVVLVLAPHTYALTSAELTTFHLDVAEQADVPTLVYHLPQSTGSWLEPGSLAALHQHPNILGVKDSSTDVDRKLALVAAGAELDGFALLTGHAGSLATTVRAGATGSITAVANLRQRQVAALHAAVVDGDATAAERLQGELARLTDGLKRVGSTPATVKAALQLQGAIEERWCRPPLGSVPPDRLDHLRTALLR